MENNDKYSEKIYQINKIDNKESDERYPIGENREDSLNTDIEVLKLRTSSSQKNIDYLEQKTDERNQMDMSNEKGSDERDQIIKNDKEKVTEDI